MIDSLLQTLILAINSFYAEKSAMQIRTRKKINEKFEIVELPGHFSPFI